MRDRRSGRISGKYINNLTNPIKPNDGICTTDGKLIPKEVRQEIVEQVSSLPILNQLPEIIEAVGKNLITIIEAQTGSGKTTQIGKVALLTNLRGGKLNRVHMTQPRVIAALSNASRISDELLSQFNNPNFTLGEIVGYRTGNYDKSSEHTRLLLTTDAQEVLRQLVSKILPNYLILDEVHTYTVDIEILLALMKQYMAENPEIATKFIIMTATLDKNLILNYLQGIVDNIPYFFVPGKIHKIDEEILPSNEFISSIVENTDINGDGKVLVFVEGKKKIYDTIKTLERIFGKNMKEAKISQIHSELNAFFTKATYILKKELGEEVYKKAINETKINQFKYKLEKIIENKIKNVSYEVNLGEIYAELYEIFYDEIKNKLRTDKYDTTLNEVYAIGLETLNIIMEKLNFGDLLVEEFLLNLKKILGTFEQYKEDTVQQINNSKLKDVEKITEELRNIKFSSIDGFGFMIRRFLQKTIDKGVNKSLVEKNINSAFDTLHPSKVYDLFKRQIESIFYHAKSRLINNYKKELKKLNNFNEEELKILVNYLLEDGELPDFVDNEIRTDISQIKENFSAEIQELKKVKSDIIASLGRKIFETNLYDEFVDNFQNTINEIDKFLSSKVKIIPLHSDLSQKEQEKAFDNDTKVIVATDIAEMSLTIPNTKVVIDSGKVRIAYLDDDGVETLEVVNISQAQSKQRKGRTGRTGPGKYIWANQTEPEKLEAFPITDIEKGNFARHYLILAAGGLKMEEMDFLHKPKEKHIELIKKHLIKLGALGEDGNITEIGEKIVTIPSEPYIARILYEAQKRNCLGNAIILGSILESKTFLSTENKNWKKIKLGPSVNGSELFYFYEWYNLLTSNKIDGELKKQLIKLGINKEILDCFNDNEHMLYEVINLEKIGIKEKYFFEVIQNIERLTRYFQDQNIEINEIENQSKDVLISLLSGMIDNIFECERKDILKHHEKGIFMASNMGKLNVNKNNEHVYFGKTIKIKLDNGREHRIAQKLTRINKEFIAEFLDIQTEGKTLSLTTKVVGKKGNRKRVKVLKQIKPIEGINLDQVIFERGKKSFHYMLKHVYLPELLIYENKYFIELIKDLNKDAPEGKKVNINKFKNLLGELLDELFEYVVNSEESPKKIEEKIKNDKTIYDKIILGDNPNIIDFLTDPYI